MTLVGVQLKPIISWFVFAKYSIHSFHELEHG